MLTTLTRTVDRFLEGQRWLEPLGDWLQNLISSLYRGLGKPGRGLKTFVHGTWLGHPLHPLITDLPIGAWTLAVIFDVVWLFQRGRGIAVGADLTVGVGALASLAALVTGFTDWNETVDRERRVGLTHGLLNTVVIALYLASFGVRVTGGSRLTAIVIALVGYAGLVSAAWLGGEMVFGIGTGVNHHAWQSPPIEWAAVIKAADLLEGTLQKVEVQGTPILLTRRGARICAIGETCSHAGGPLSEGTPEANLVVCPWHASRFDLCTGAVRGGPATMSQVRYETRVVNGEIQVRRSADSLQPN